MDAAARVEFTTIIVSVRDPAAAHLLKGGKRVGGSFQTKPRNFITVVKSLRVAAAASLT
jgi:hypothetical protein